MEAQDLSKFSYTSSSEHLVVLLLPASRFATQHLFGCISSISAQKSHPKVHLSFFYPSSCAGIIRVLGCVEYPLKSSCPDLWQKVEAQKVQDALSRRGKALQGQ